MVTKAGLDPEMLLKHRHRSLPSDRAPYMNQMAGYVDAIAVISASEEETRKSKG